MPSGSSVRGAGTVTRADAIGRLRQAALARALDGGRLVRSESGVLTAG